MRAYFSRILSMFVFTADCLMPIRRATWTCANPEAYSRRVSRSRGDRAARENSTSPSIAAASSLVITGLPSAMARASSMACSSGSDLRTRPSAPARRASLISAAFSAMLKISTFMPALRSRSTLLAGRDLSARDRSSRTTSHSMRLAPCAVRAGFSGSRPNWSSSVVTESEDPTSLTSASDVMDTRRTPSRTTSWSSTIATSVEGMDVSSVLPCGGPAQAPDSTEVYWLIACEMLQASTLRW